MPKVLGKFILPKINSAPVSPAEGEAYYNTTSNTAYVYVGGSWVDMASDINTLSKINSIITDATLIDTADSRLSDARTPSDNSVTYAKVHSNLKSNATDNDGAWDFSANGIIYAAFSSGATTVSFSNLQQNKALKVRLTITNSATFTLPSFCEIQDGSAVASGTNGTYNLWFDCWEDTVSSEIVLVSISKEAV